MRLHSFDWTSRPCSVNWDGVQDAPRQPYHDLSDWPPLLDCTLRGWIGSLQLQLGFGHGHDSRGEEPR
jgi:hypothetical protein